MKKIIYIITLLLLLTLQLGNLSYADEFIDSDRDKIQDNIDDPKRQDKDPDTLPENVRYICTIQDIEGDQDPISSFIGFGCSIIPSGETDPYYNLGRYSSIKESAKIDSDRDGVMDFYDTIEPDTDPENKDFVCRKTDIKSGFFNCSEEDLGVFSQNKKDTRVDSDRDGIKDFEDQQDLTSDDQRRFVCDENDFRNLRGTPPGLQYGCTDRSRQLGVYSSLKEAFILDGDTLGSGGGFNGGIPTPGPAIIDGGQIQNGGLNLDTGNIKEGTERNNPLKELQRGGDGFILSEDIGERGIYDVLVTAARDLKNIFLVFATIFFLYLVLRLLLSENSEDDISKFRRGIIWIIIGIVVMQLAFTFVSVVYDGGLGSGLSIGFVGAIIDPLISLLVTIASFFFVIMGIIAFYRLIASNGEEQVATDAKTTVVNAILGFILVQIADTLVSAVYNGSSDEDVDVTVFNETIIIIINWLNSFVGIAVVVMIIYTGAQVLLSAGDDEKLANAKKSLVYIIIGIVLLAINLLIFTFFFNPGI